MKITLEWLEDEGACEDGIEYYETLGVNDFFEVLGCCLRDDKKSYFDWLIHSGDIKALEKCDVLKFCDEYGDVQHVRCAELAFLFIQSVSFKEHYLTLLNELGVEGVKDLTLVDVSSKDGSYWWNLYRAASDGSVEESVYSILLRMSEAGYKDVLITSLSGVYWLNQLHSICGDERFSYRSQLDFLVKELKV